MTRIDEVRVGWLSEGYDEYRAALARLCMMGILRRDHEQRWENCDEGMEVWKSADQRQDTVKMATNARLLLMERRFLVNDTKYICPST